MTALIRALLIIALGLALTATATPAQAADTMSTERAGNYYLRWACNSNAKHARFYNAVYGADGWFYAKEFHGAKRTRIQRRAARAADADYTFAQKLELPPAAWPTSVRRPVRLAIPLLLKIVEIERKISVAERGARVVRLLNRLDDVSGDLRPKTRKIRLRLGLPDLGQGCG